MRNFITSFIGWWCVCEGGGGRGGGRRREGGRNPRNVSLVMFQNLGATKSCLLVARGY